MPKLVFYSDFRIGQTESIDNRLLNLLPLSAKIGYIPSDSDYKRKYFNKVIEHYNDIGIFDVMYFDLKDEYNPENLPELLKCDAIHLSGGNVYQFLSLIRLRNFGPVLKKFTQQGGILVGVSAGAMLCAPTIGLCEFFDNTKIKPSEQKSLALVDFDFFPHFDFGPTTIKRLCDYSLKNKRTIYACDDCEGLVIDGTTIDCIGNVAKIEMGHIHVKN